MKQRRRERMTRRDMSVADPIRDGGMRRCSGVGMKQGVGEGEGEGEI